MNTCCAYCARPLHPQSGTFVGPVRYCDDRCVTEWYSLPQHDRRHARRPIVVERRGR